MIQAIVLPLLLAQPGAFAADVSRPFQKVSPSHQAYHWVSHLERAGYATGSPENTFDGRSLLTRYEFAIAAERIFQTLQPRVLSATRPGDLAEDLRIYRLLLDEFDEEIAALGPDVEELRRQARELQQRLTHMHRSGGPLVAAAFGSRGFGLQPALRSLADTTLPEPESPARLLPSPPSLKPGLAARLGPTLLGFNIQSADQFGMAAGAPWEDPADWLSYRLQLSLPFGRQQLAAYFNREGGLWDRYNWLGTDLAAGPSRDIGASVAGSLRPGVGYLLQGGTVRPEDDPLRLSYLRGSVNFAPGNGLTLGAGYERLRQTGRLGSSVSSAYFLNVGRRFGDYTRFDLYFRYPGSGNGASDPGSSSALTQITVRF